jgi:hypothetical protein
MRLDRQTIRRLVLEEISGKRKPQMRSLSSFLFEDAGEDIEDKEKLAAALRRANRMSPEEAAKWIADNIQPEKGATSISKALNTVNGMSKPVRKLLDAGLKDGDPKDEAGAASPGERTLGSLSPTQIEIEFDSSVSFPLTTFDSEGAGIKPMCAAAKKGSVQRIGPPGNDFIIVNGDLIIDGHHRWSSLFSVTGPEGKIACIDLGLKGLTGTTGPAVAQVGVAAALGPGKKLPAAKAGKKNILGASKETILGYLESYRSKMKDDYCKSCASDPDVSDWFGLKSDDSPDTVKDKIFAKMADNLSKMPGAAAGAPPRLDMPQFDATGGSKASSVKKVVDNLTSGETNFKEPVVAKESRSRKSEDEVILERWHKLAGLIK